jgi:glycine/serine hydroxymethyltransferase
MEIADLIHRALSHIDQPAELAAIRENVKALTRRFPLPH